ncbi:uncharacterized protein LOC133795500 [Humulus lupulus]|uniref:uncharacterized protein LOC133795500 n=1 Tax=Humulus lupulus TaxID=3486 RepID=UPI002B415675|nr:uncharacterized protein LOC133795500 [Humulus lupulus]
MDGTWHYTVKSAYHLLQYLKEDQHLDADSAFWRKLWSLKVPPKVKNFFWNALTGCLPTRVLLRLKHVDVSWRKAGFQLNAGEISIFASWFRLSLCMFSKEESDRMAMLCWAIWKRRNDLIWQQKHISTDEIVDLAKHSLDQWINAQESDKHPPIGMVMTGDGSEHWVKPQKNTIKVNVDASIAIGRGTFGLGWVARDQTRSLLEVHGRNRNGVVTPEVVEAMGVKEALSWIKSKNWPSIVVESDYLRVVQAYYKLFMFNISLGFID